MEDTKKKWCVLDRSADWLPKGCAEVVAHGLEKEEAKGRVGGAGLEAAPEPDEAMAAVVEDGRAWVSDPVPMDRLEPGQPPVEARLEGEEPREAVPGSDGVRVVARIRRRWIAPLVAAAVVAVLALCVAGVVWVSQPSEPAGGDAAVAAQEDAAEEEGGEADDAEDEAADEEEGEGSSDGEAAADDGGDAPGAADATASGSDVGGGTAQAASQGTSSQGGSSQPSAPASDPAPAPELEPVAPACNHNWVETTVTTQSWVYVCDVCGADINGDIDAHLKSHGTAGSYHPEQRFETVGTGTYYCTICGATR